MVNQEYVIFVTKTNEYYTGKWWEDNPFTLDIKYAELYNSIEDIKKLFLDTGTGYDNNEKELLEKLEVIEIKTIINLL